MKILGKLITDVASLVKKRFICISETYFEMSKNGIHMLYLPCSITFDGDFDRNSVSFLVRIYPLRISRQGPDIILNEEENPPFYNYPYVNSSHCVITNLIHTWVHHYSLYSIIIDLREHLLTIPTDIIMDDRMIPFEDIRWYDPPILLGKGNFAVAYVGHYQGQDVACKILKEECVASDQEVMAMNYINNPHCVHLFGVSRVPTDRRLVIVMELAGETLYQLLIERHITLSNHQLKVMVLEIAEGLESIHRCGYIHRDIKLDNLLMKDGHILIADFGFARLLPPSSIVLTNRGTPLIEAPELLCGVKANDKVDVFSFGCVVSEIFSRVICYSDSCDLSSQSVQMFYQSVINGLRPTLPDNIPEEVKSLIRRCWDENKLRPSMSDCVEAIKQWDETTW